MSTQQEGQVNLEVTHLAKFKHAHTHMHTIFLFNMSLALLPFFYAGF